MPSPGGTRCTWRDAGPQRQRRLQLGALRRHLGPGRDAVDGDAGPHHVATGGRSPRQRAGRVGGVDERRRVPGLLQHADGGIEPGELGDGGRHPRLVGPGQVRPQALPPQLRPGQQRLDERHELVRPGAHPVHAGVDLEVDPHGRAPGLPGLVGQRLQVVDRVRGGREPPADELVELVLGLLGQDEHRGQDAGLAQRHPLLDERHAQALGAGLERGPGHGSGAVAVAVGLDDHPEGRRGHGLGQHAHVGGDGAQVHLHPGLAPGVGQRHRHRDSRTPGSSPGRSEATSPRAGPAAAARPCSQARGRGRLERRDLLREQGADDPGQHIPGPRRGQPLVPCGRQEDGAGRLGHDGRRPLQQHDRARRRGQLPRRGQAVRPRLAPGQQPELTVVRREHRRSRPVPQERRGAVGRPGQREQPVAVHHDRHLRLGHQLAHLGGGGVAAAQAGPDDQRLEPVEVLRHRGRPRGRGQRPGHGLRRHTGVVLPARGREAHVAGTGPHRRRRDQPGRARHAGGAGHDGHRGVPLVGVGGPRHQPAADVLRGHQMGTGAADIEPDVGHLDLARVDRSRRQQQARLHRRERDGAVGVEHAVAGSPGQPVDPARDVDREHLRVTGVRRVPGAAEPGAVGGVDDQVGAVDPGRDLGRLDHPHGDAPARQPPCRRPAVIAVVALAGDDHHPPPVRAAQHGDGGPRHRRAGPLDQLLHRFGGGSVDLAHLGGRDDRDHGGRGLTRRGG